MYPDEIKNKAFQLYCLGWSLTKIARKIGVDWKTVKEWSVRKKWREKKERIDQKTGEILEEKSVDWKSQTIKQLIEIRDSLIKRYGKAKTGNVEQLTKAILGLNEQIALLKGEVTQRGEQEIRIIFEDV
ncbi:MAG: hypothetical protein J7K87_00680 [Candidatus Aenigmarchaeota archaeon]|nr:hypothetical protein [Candidatus Aenigmarchaeota archaeon]